MKKLVFNIILLLAQVALFAQPQFKIDGEEVYSGDDVIFHKIDDHTWVGTGHVMSNESLYLVEGNDKALLN